MRHSLVLCAVVLVGGCDSTSPPATNTPPAATNPAALMTTLEDLAMFGEKHVGTDSGHMAGEYVRGRMTKAGLTDVHKETFAVPRWDLASKSLSVSVDGKASTPPLEVFEGSGSGHVAAAEVVWVADATPMALAGKDLHGKVALVERNPAYHRSTQYLNVTDAGAVAMLYVSAAPMNLTQVGSVRRTWGTVVGPIPAVTVGADDGGAIKAALAGKKAVTATIDVVASTTRAEGDNIIGRIPGREPGEIVLGAHYDSWFIGSTDNGSGIATMLALAERRAKEQMPRYTLVFIGYDGEEVALFGGYDFLHKHIVQAKDPVLAVLNFEIPSAAHSGGLGLARSGQKALDDAVRAGGLNDMYLLYTGLDAVPAVFGGIIPTDIQGIYRAGVPTMSTAVDSPYYHTTADTPDKVDTTFLAAAVDAFDLAVETLLGDDAARFADKDPKLWSAAVTPRARAAGEPWIVDVVVKDGAGAAAAAAPINASLLVDDFFEAQAFDATTDAAGKATFTFLADKVAVGSGNRFLHVTAGPKWPLVEQVVVVP